VSDIVISVLVVVGDEEKEQRATITRGGREMGRDGGRRRR